MKAFLLSRNFYFKPNFFQTR